MPAQECHICSFIIQCQPGRLADVHQELLCLQGVEVHKTDPGGKIVITLEADSDQQITDITSHLGKCKGVLSCNMVFHQIDSGSTTGAVM